MGPQHVKPNLKSNKNDAADAETICEAVTRPNTRFVPIKSAEQQGVLALHRGREGLTRTKRLLLNQIKGLLREHGVVMSAGVHHAPHRVPDLIEDAQTQIPTTLRMLLQKMDEHLRFNVRQIEEIDVLILDWHREFEAIKRLAQIPGIGSITATSIVASVGDASDFDNRRQLDAWLRLVPRQRSSGGKNRLLGISKRGNRYIRTLLMLGAQAVLRVVEKRIDRSSEWLKKLRDRRRKNIAALELANKNARTICALLKTALVYEPLRQWG
jgi:transposase